MTPTSYGSTTEPDPTDTGSSYDTDAPSLPDGPFKDWPGAGPTPDPEEDGFRAKILEIIEARRKRDRDEYEARCEEAKGYYGGTTPTDPEPTTPTPTEPTYGTTNPTPTTPTPTTTYGTSTPTTPTPGGTTTGYSTSS